MLFTYRGTLCTLAKSSSLVYVGLSNSIHCELSDANDPTNLIHGVLRLPRADGSHESEVGENLSGRWVNACVLNDLGVVDPVLGILRVLKLMEPDLAEPLHSDPEGPHDLSVAHDDDPLV